MVQLSHPYMTTEKTIALTRQTFVCKVVSLLFNMLTEEVRTKSMASKMKTQSQKTNQNGHMDHNLV